MAHPFLEGLPPTWLIAHRGGAALAPENTLPAFEQAVRIHRADVLELDVHATADGELVVAHDPTVERCTDGTGAIAALPLAELRRLDAGFRFTPDEGRTHPFRGTGVRIPTLRELLRAQPSVRLNLELKPETPGLERELVRVLREEGAVARTCVGSERDEVGERLVAALPEGCHFFPRNALTEVVMALRLGGERPARPYQVLDMPLSYEGLRLVDADFLAAAAREGLWVNVWTIDEPDELRRLVAEGVGGIMTDRPDLLRQVLDEAGRTRR